MNFIDTNSIKLIGQLVALRKQPNRSDGQQSQSRHCYFTAADGTLRVCYTDGHFSFLDFYSLMGAEEQWRATVRADTIQRLFTKITAIDKATEEDPGVALAFSNDGYLLLKKRKFEARISLAVMASAFSGPDISRPSDEWTAISYPALRDALSFVSRRPDQKDDEEQRLTCTLFCDGTVVANHGNITLVDAGPIVPSDWTLTTRDARRLLIWLELLGAASRAIASKRLFIIGCSVV